jgi:hypothetical protein
MGARCSMHALDFPGMVHGANLGRNYRLAAVHLRYQIPSLDDFVKRSWRRKPAIKCLTRAPLCS